MSPGPISVVSPVSDALERVKQVLFQPFDLSRWLAIGFCAWLATLGERWGAGGGTRWSSRGHSGDLREAWDHLVEYVLANLSWLVPLILVLVSVALGLGVLLLWLSSRGRFMFLHNVATNRADVVYPWNACARHGNSLFLFRLIVAVATLCLMAPFLAAGTWAVVRMARDGAVTPGLFLVAAGAIASVAFTGLVVALIEKFTKDFVVPIMWLRTSSCRAGWSEFLGLLSAHPLTFALYILFHILLSMAAGILVMALILLTCCLAGCLIAIPYLGTVFLLPMLVFFRCYSLSFLAQFGSHLDVFRAAAGVPTDMGPVTNS